MQLERRGTVSRLAAPMPVLFVLLMLVVNTDVWLRRALSLVADNFSDGWQSLDKRKPLLDVSFTPLRLCLPKVAAPGLVETAYFVMFSAVILAALSTLLQVGRRLAGALMTLA